MKSFTGGMNRDVLFEKALPTQYYDALDIQHEIINENTVGSITVDDGNTLAFTVPNITTQNQLLVLFIPYTTSGINFSGTSERTGFSLFSGTVSSALADGNAWATAIQAAINAIIGPSGGTVTAFSSQGSGTPFNWWFQVSFTQSVVWDFDGSTNLSFITQEGYFGSEVGYLIPFYAIQHLNQLVVFSSKNHDPAQSYNNAVGEIGIVTLVTGIWTYRRLTRTKKFQFSTTNTMESAIEGIITGRNGVYFTDNDNPPRVFYYDYATSYDNEWSLIKFSPTFITTENPTGYYYYDNIDQSIKLQLQPNDATIDLVSVTSGGALTAGVKKYSVRFYISDIAASPFSSLSNDVSVALTPSPSIFAQGGSNGQQTAQKVTLTIANCDPTLYDFVELACIEFNQGAVSGTIVGKYALSSSEVTIIHTGVENTQSDLDLSLLPDLGVYIERSKNLAIFSERLFLSNIAIKEEPDLSDWGQTEVTLSEVVETISSVATGTLNSGALPAFSFAKSNEFYDPLNTFNRKSYMPIETYRFGIIIHWTDGSKSSPIWIGDHQFSTSGCMATDDPTNQGDVRLRAFQPTVDFTNFPIDFTLVKGYEIVRAECIKEVLAAGWGMASYGVPEAGYYGSGWPLTQGVAQPANGSTLMNFFSPDIYFGLVDISPAAGDQVYNYGVVNAFNGPATAIYGAADRVQAWQFNGYADTGAPEILTVEEGEFIPFNQYGTKVIGGGLKGSTLIYTSGTSSGGCSIPSLWLKTDNAITERTANNNYFNCLAFYVRPISDKYGDYRNTQYISCGYYREITDYNTLSYTDTVYGGDTFVQQHWIKLIYSSNDSPVNAHVGFSYYTWSRVNGQMRAVASPSILTFPLNTTNVQDWLGLNNTSAGQEDLIYDEGYSAEGAQPQLYPGYNPDLQVTINLPTRLQFSEPKPSNSIIDSYRKFPALNFKDYTTNDGQINAVFSLGNRLIIMQEKVILDQPVDFTAVITTQDGLPLTLGSGDTLSAKAQPITRYGLFQKGASLKYKSRKGGESIAWFDALSKNFMRLSGDGVRVLSSENFVQSWFYNNTSLVENDLDARMCFDQRRQELTFTARGGSVAIGWWTIIFNEANNAFTTFRSYKPKTYMEFLDFVLSVIYDEENAAPGQNNKVYKHIWTSGATPRIYQDLNGYAPYVYGFVNKTPEIEKTFLASWIDTTIAPVRVEFSLYSATTGKTAIIATATVIKQRRDNYVYYVPGKTSDNTKLRSKFLGVKIFLSYTTTARQKIVEFFTKFFYKSRNIGS